MSQLPEEIIIIIFKCLNPHELLKVSCVCKRWRNTALLPLFWTSTSVAIENVQIKSFTSFVTQIPFMKALSLTVFCKGRPDKHEIDIRGILQPLHHLECLSLEFSNCDKGIFWFPVALKHLTIKHVIILSDDVLREVADCCPDLEFLNIQQMLVYPSIHCSPDALNYCLTKLAVTLKSLHLNIYDLGVSETSLSKCKQLTYLDMKGNMRTETAQALTGLKLLESLAWANFTDDSLHTVFTENHLEQVKMLTLCEAALYQSLLICIATVFPNLENFNVYNCLFSFEKLLEIILSLASLKLKRFGLNDTKHGRISLHDLERLVTEVMKIGHVTFMYAGKHTKESIVKKNFIPFDVDLSSKCCKMIKIATVPHSMKYCVDSTSF